MQEPQCSLGLSLAAGLGLAGSILAVGATLQLLRYCAAMSLWGLGLGF